MHTGHPIRRALLAVYDKTGIVELAQGLREFRVRHHEHIARLEVPIADMPRLLAPGVREAVVQELKRLGFAYVALDLQGFRSGSLNETLPAAKTRRAGG